MRSVPFQYLWLLIAFAFPSAAPARDAVSQLCHEAVLSMRRTIPKSLARAQRLADFRTLVRDFGGKEKNPKAFMLGLLPIAGSAGIVTTTRELPDGIIALEIKPLIKSKSRINKIAALVQEAFGVNLVLHPEPLSTGDAAMHIPGKKDIYLPYSVVIDGYPGEAVFHEIVHAYHHHLELTLGAHILSGHISKNDFSDEIDSLETGGDYDVFNLSELGAWAASIRILSGQIALSNGNAPLRESRAMILREALASYRRYTARVKVAVTDLQSELRGIDTGDGVMSVGLFYPETVSCCLVGSPSTNQSLPLVSLMFDRFNEKNENISLDFSLPKSQGLILQWQELHNARIDEKGIPLPNMFETKREKIIKGQLFEEIRPIAIHRTERLVHLLGALEETLGKFDGPLLFHLTSRRDREELLRLGRELNHHFTGALY